MVEFVGQKQRDWMAAITGIATVTVGAVARTGAYDRAGTADLTIAMLQQLQYATDALGIDAKPLIKKAIEQVESGGPPNKNLN